MIRKYQVTQAALVFTLLFPASASAEELLAPALGTRMTWECQGPFTSRYDLQVVSITDRVVRYEGSIDEGNYFAEKHQALTGTSLWYRLFGNRRQWFDFEDFSDYRKMRPGSRFKGAVPAEHESERWVWKYEISVGQSQPIKHPVLGEVKLIPVSEERSVFHGDYWSRMRTMVAPSLGISVSWTYEDHHGTETCDLAAVTIGQG